jgi:hypothetical protein
MAFSKKIQRILIAALAMMGLFASSVSACTCSHHQEPVKTETPSCHSHSHSETAAVGPNAASKGIDSPCKCVLAKPAPAIVSKSDKKRSQLQKEVADADIQTISFERESLVANASTAAILFSSEAYLSKRISGLLPARAPPRL